MKSRVRTATRIATPITALAACVAPLIAAVPCAAAVPVVPITGTAPDGRTYGQLAEDWWQWAVSIPKSRSPLIDHFGHHAYEGQSGDVFFLAPALDSDSTRDIVVEPGQSLFFPVVSSLFFNGPDESYTEAEMRGFLDDFLSRTSTFYATIDGQQVPSPWAYRAATPPGGFTVNLPADNVYDLELSGPTGPAVADGFWLLVEPLPWGTHTLRFEGGTEDPLNYTYFSSVVYRITVPESNSLMLLGIAAPLLLRRQRQLR